MVWLPDGRMLVTERAGEILVFKDDKFTGEKFTGVPEVFAKGQGGLLDIELHPNYKDNQWIYISYSKPVEGGATTAVSRFKLNGNQVTDLQEIFTAKPYIPADFHFGSRIVFDKNNFSSSVQASAEHNRKFRNLTMITERYIGYTTTAGYRKIIRL